MKNTVIASEELIFVELKRLDRAEYEKVVGRQENCFITFTKQNCQICERLKPTLEKIADEYTGSDAIHFYNMEINDPEARDIFKGWQLVGVPQTVIMKNGTYQEALPGALDAAIYRTEVNKLLGKKQGFGAKLKSLFGK